MRHPLSTNPTGNHQPCPTHRIRVRLPLATVEELDHLAQLAHSTRQQILRQLINAALISDAPLRPDGPDLTSRLTAHTQLTHARSLELARGSAEASAPPASDEQAPSASSQSSGR